MSAAFLPNREFAEAPDEAPLPVRRIGGIAVSVTDGARIIEMLIRRMDRGQHTRLAFANAHCVNVAADDERYRGSLGDFTVLSDGVGVDVASKLLHGEAFPDNLNGTDFVPRLLRSLPGRRRVALIGAAPGIARAATEKLRTELPQHEFRAIADGFFRPGLETEIVLARLRKFSPDVTLVALGVPKQELFIAQHLTIKETTVAIGVGALFDFLSGRVARAPCAWRLLRLEWLFRLALEPSRLWRRYVLGNPRFLLRVLGEMLGRGALKPS